MKENAILAQQGVPHVRYPSVDSARVVVNLLPAFGTTLPHE